MAFTDVFGGELIFPSQLSYLMITTAVDIELQWPTEQQITGDSVVADVMDVDTTVPSLNIDMPDARNTSTGNKATFNNRGANSFTVRDNTGGTIQQVLTGEQWVVVLTDNSTQAGVWTTFQLGGNAATPASASGLAGAGLKAISALLNQKIDSDVEASTPVTVVDGDRAKCLVYTAGAGVADLPNAGGVGNDWFFMLRNSGSGTLAVTPPSGNIDGSSSINLDPNDSAFIFTDGVDYFTIGLSTGSTIAFDFVSLPIPGSGDFVLSGANLNRISYRFTGALTGDRKVVVPDTTQQYWCDNQTTGAFVLTIGTAAQASPPELDAGKTTIFYSDSTDVIDAVNAVSVSFPILISQGGTSANNAPDALANLGGVPTAREINTNALSGLAGGGDLTLDRNLLLDIDNLTVELVIDTAADTFAFFDDSAAAIRKAPLSLIAGVIVEDEGTPLATVADTLDFVGAGVVASGVGGTKTITIPGSPVGPSAAADRMLKGDGSGGWVDAGPSLTTDGLDLTLGAGSLFINSGANQITLGVTGTTAALVSSGGVIDHFRTDEPWRFEDGFYIQATGTPNISVPGFAQLWVQNSTPQDLRFIDDAGATTILSEQLKRKLANTTRAATGVLDDPDLSGWDLDVGLWRFWGSIEFGVNPATNGGIDLNWSTTGVLGQQWGALNTHDDSGGSPAPMITGVFDPGNVGDLTLTYAVRNDATRAWIHGFIRVTADSVVGFQWGPRLAGSLTVVEGSWISFQKM